MTAFNLAKTKKRKLEDFEPHKTRKKKKVPTEFIEHILSLGFNEDDAPTLYEDKDSWMGISTGGKVSCVVKGCKFETPIASDELFEHCRTKHQWRDYPCPESNCNFIAYCSMALKKHALFHTRPPSTQYEFACSKKNCKWTFSARVFLQRHENVHENIQLACIYCPFTSATRCNLTIHQREHFNIRDYKCDICGKAFKQQAELNKHFDKLHSGYVTKCFVCDFKGAVHNVRNHLKRKHKIRGYHWDAKKEKFVKM